MKLQGFTLVAGLLVSGAALAAGMDELDTDGDGLASYEEVVAVYTDLSPENFAKMDANGDEMIDAEELAAAEEAGLLEVMEN